MNSNEVKIGSLISYVLIIFNSLYGIFITPIILSSVGEIDFGVYKTITSLSSTLLILDLGLGGTLIRYIAKFKSEKDEGNVSKIISIVFKQGIFITTILLTVCIVVFFNIPFIFKNTFDAVQITLSKKIFFFLAIELCMHIFENILNGVICGNNKFIFANGLKLIRIILRILFIVILLSLNNKIIILAIIDLCLTAILIIVESLYIKFVLKQKMFTRVEKTDKCIIKESFKYTLLMFTTSIVVQVNSNLDNVLIGAIIGAASVTIYSFGLLIFNMFQSLSIAISEVMLPTVINVLKNDEKYDKTVDIIIKVGRIQFIILGAAFIGFIVLGKRFIQLWLGNGFDDVYYITIILMVPSLLELCVNLCLTVLRAKNMLGFRTIIIFGFTIFNLIFTSIGLKLSGYFYAALGTALSTLIGSVMIMGIYYYKKFSFNMLKIYKRIFKKIWLCLLLSGIIVLFISKLFNNNWLSFIILVVIFCVLYLIMLIFYGFNKNEKRHIPFLNKIFFEEKEND